ncbi:MAG: T9SS type A sorting domain-containing protein [Bacteroidetes bacterium]|nr:T9SS type A sorting domain-containing protein [Bacteroidota bacterium]
MKTVILAICLFLCVNCLIAQAQFHLRYSFSKPDTASELKSLQIFDYEADGDVEVIAAFNNDSTWTVTIFDQSGVIINEFEGFKNHAASYERESLLSAQLFRFDNNLYMAVVFLYGWYITNEKAYYFKADVDIYVVESELTFVSSQSISYPGSDATRLLDSNLTIFNHNNKIWIGLGSLLERVSRDIGEYTQTKYESFLSLLRFDTTLILVTEFMNCYQLFPRTGVGLGYYEFSSYSPFIPPNSGNYEFWLHSFDFNNVIPTKDELFHMEAPGSIWTPILLLASNDHSDDHGPVVYRRTRNATQFICFSNNPSSVSWERADSNLKSNFYGTANITASSSLPIADRDYLMYFDRNRMEIRDLANGDIVHYEYVSIEPFEILRDENDTWFFTKTDHSYSVYNIEIETLLISSVQENPGPSPNEFYLSQNYPNPFNSSTRIKFSIPSAGHVLVKLFNLKGEVIQTLIDGYLDSNTHHLSIDDSIELASGIYFYQLVVNNRVIQTRKMLLIR